MKLKTIFGNKRIVTCSKCKELGIHHSKGICYSCYHKIWTKRNKKHLEIYRKEWDSKNRDKLRKNEKRRYEKDKIKHFARTYVYRYKLRRPLCLLHLLEGIEVKAINFHHIDYISNLGFSVCKECHKKADKWLKEDKRC